jgi:hypothetical protein
MVVIGSSIRRRAEVDRNRQVARAPASSIAQTGPVRVAVRSSPAAMPDTSAISKGLARVRALASCQTRTRGPARVAPGSVRCRARADGPSPRCAGDPRTGVSYLVAYRDDGGVWQPP